MCERSQEGFGRCYLEGVNTLSLERAASAFQPHDHEQTNKTQQFPRATGGTYLVFESDC